MNILSLLSAAVLVVSVVACSSTTTGTGTGNGAGTGTGAAADTNGGAAAGTCDSACTYYLQCKGVDASYQSACIEKCQADGYTAQELSDVQQLDCPSAVAAIEGSRPAPNQNSGGSSGGAAKDCYGCQSDGSSCVYVAGAYASACDPSCC